MTLKPHISELFKGTIWRMEIDGLNNIMLLETRDSGDKVTYFSSIDLNGGKVYFKDITTPERWLTGIETAYDGVLLIHYYQSESGPSHKGLLAIDAFTGETLWSNYNYAFDHLTSNGPVVYDIRIHPRKLFLLDIKTGATTRVYLPSVYQEAENNIIAPNEIMPDSLPVNLLPVHPYGNTVHYLERNNFRIVSLHALKSGQLTQALYVFNKEMIVYEDLLNTDIQKIQPEAFILHHNHLIYIKNRVELKVLSL